MSDILADDAFVRLFQARAGLDVDGVAGRDTLARLDTAFPVTVAPAAVVNAASMLPADYWPMLSHIESADRPYVKAATSSGSGLYQFLKATWIGEGGFWGSNPALAFGGLKPSVEEQRNRAISFTAKNAAYLASKKIPINKASLYAAHFFGPKTAAEVISADVKDRADVIAGPAATRANRSILENKTVGQFLSWLHDKTGEWAR